MELWCARRGVIHGVLGTDDWGRPYHFETTNSHLYSTLTPNATRTLLNFYLSMQLTLAFVLLQQTSSFPGLPGWPSKCTCRERIKQCSPGFIFNSTSAFAALGVKKGAVNVGSDCIRMVMEDDSIHELGSFSLDSRSAIIGGGGR